ncbi:uncharacterized protein LOC131008400 [Salvia miltiorrhiza]|uniref:uncharacterized protein LOC131008400 n=1 Tax=Salvia miltiorrhiza TaxID=226208 RepID=UPI0025AC1023|nr:uncharacterized protein LOC131008400 [Salvia miltiorrhiza]
MWRLLNNLIPTAANLKRHGIPIDGICARCGDRWDTEHNILHCPKSHKVWRESSFWKEIQQSQGMVFVDVVSMVFKIWNREGYDLWCIMVWQIWVNICKEGHKEVADKFGQGTDCDVSEETCATLLDVFIEAQPTFRGEALLGVELGKNKWFPPRPGIFRVDVDAMFDEEKGCFGVGIIVRDHEGRVCNAVSKKTKASSSVMMAEIMAIVHGILACIELELGQVELFTNSLLAARAMATPEEDKTYLPDDVCDILGVARKNFLLRVSHMYRSANRAAHSLAQFARTLDSPCCWTESLPRWLGPFVIDDMV